MPVKKDGRRPLEGSGAPSPSQSIENDIGVSDCSTAAPFANATGSRQTAPRFPVRTSDAAAWALFTLVVGTVLIAACVVLTLGWPS